MSKGAAMDGDIDEITTGSMPGFSLVASIGVSLLLFVLNRACLVYKHSYAADNVMDVPHLAQAEFTSY
jgi:hypothetical protein